MQPSTSSSTYKRLSEQSAECPHTLGNAIILKLSKKIGHIPCEMSITSCSYLEIAPGKGSTATPNVIFWILWAFCKWQFIDLNLVGLDLDLDLI